MTREPKLYLHTACFRSPHNALHSPSIYLCVTLPGPPGQTAGSKWRLVQFSGCRLQILGAETGRDLDKSTTQFYQVRLTTAPRLV